MGTGRLERSSGGVIAVAIRSIRNCSYSLAESTYLNSSQ